MIVFDGAPYRYEQRLLSKWRYEANATFTIINNTDKNYQFTIDSEDTRYTISDKSVFLKAGENKIISVYQELYIKGESRDFEENALDDLKKITIQWEDGEKTIPVSFQIEPNYVF